MGPRQISGEPICRWPCGRWIQYGRRLDARNSLVAINQSWRIHSQSSNLNLSGSVQSIVLTGGGGKADIVLSFLLTAALRLCLVFKSVLCRDLVVPIPSFYMISKTVRDN